MSFTKRLGFLSSFSFPLLIVCCYYFGGTYAAFLPMVFGYICIPLIDVMMGKDARNVLKEDLDALVNDVYFDFLVYAHVWMQWAMVLWGAYVLSTGNMPWIQTIGFIISQGIYASTIINVAHELGHRTSAAGKFHAKFALISVCYSYFIVEHNKGHHVHVATPADPASSKKNQSLYQFWKQTLVGSLASAWRLEVNRLKKKGLSSWSLKNEVLNGLVLSGLSFALIFMSTRIFTGQWQWIVLVFLLAQAGIAILSLEAVNYIEHYGISRKQLENGRYERVNPTHSWNANHSFSNFMLFQLQRHSDHHANASKPYQILSHLEESPQLPHGYPLMMMIALVPGFWFKKMNPILEGWQSKAA